MRGLPYQERKKKPACRRFCDNDPVDHTTRPTCHLVYTPGSLSSATHKTQATCKEFVLLILPSSCSNDTRYGGHIAWGWASKRRNKTNKRRGSVKLKPIVSHDKCLFCFARCAQTDTNIRLASRSVKCVHGVWRERVQWTPPPYCRTHLRRCWRDERVANIFSAPRMMIVASWSERTHMPRKHDALKHGFVL